MIKIAALVPGLSALDSLTIHAFVKQWLALKDLRDFIEDPSNLSEYLNVSYARKVNLSTVLADPEAGDLICCAEDIKTMVKILQQRMLFLLQSDFTIEVIEELSFT